jgi:NodT family efflux transporter outer membrane factor (OMF) lipoprotein
MKSNFPFTNFQLTLITVTVLGSLGLSACGSIGPDFKRPDAPAVAALTRNAPQAMLDKASPITEMHDKWWRAYGSPRIDALVDLALAHNPSLDVGLANLKAAQENVTAQRGFFYPTVSLGYSGSRQSLGRTLSSPLTSGASLYNLHTAGLNVGFVPDVFGTNRRQVESLQATANSQKYQLDALRITLASNVVAAAIQEQFLLEQMNIVQEAITAAAEQLKQVNILLAAGYSSGLDSAQQETTYAQTLALLPPLKKQLEQTRNLLAVLCGQLPSTPLLEADTDKASQPETPELMTHLAALPQVLPSEFVARRPDIAAAEEQLHASFAQIGVATGNMLPQLSLSANLGYANGGLSGLLTPGNQAWGLLAGITQPLFAGGTLTARKRAVEAAAQGAAAQYQSTVLTAFQNVADTLYAVDADRQSLDAAQAAQAATQRQWQMTKNQFEQGYASRFVLLSAQQTYLQAKVARSMAQALYLGDTVSLFQSLGGGWQLSPK